MSTTPVSSPWASGPWTPTATVSADHLRITTSATSSATCQDGVLGSEVLGTATFSGTDSVLAIPGRVSGLSGCSHTYAGIWRTDEQEGGSGADRRGDLRLGRHPDAVEDDRLHRHLARRRGPPGRGRPTATSRCGTRRRVARHRRG